MAWMSSALYPELFQKAVPGIEAVERSLGTNLDSYRKDQNSWYRGIGIGSGLAGRRREAGYDMSWNVESRTTSWCCFWDSATAAEDSLFARPEGIEEAVDSTAAMRDYQEMTIEGEEEGKIVGLRPCQLVRSQWATEDGTGRG